MATNPSGKRPRVRLERTIDGDTELHTAPTPQAPCDRCQAVPRGLEGHERLQARTLAASSICFQCTDCSQMWTRSYTGEGAFDWSRTRLVVDQGVALPGKSNPGP